jgi:hypothetical protein
MFTKILPAGDLFTYLKGPTDSQGVMREQPPVRIYGDDELMTSLLVAQAPFGVAPKNNQTAFGLPRRPHSEWVRHCRSQLLHFISCFHETNEIVTPPLLYKVACATEDLVLAGMPRDALHFTWYKHGKKRGSHIHGGMGRFSLRSGKRYALKLDRKLRGLFDRLVSRRLGLADPRDPAAFRIVYAARGSWKPENRELITRVCQEAARRWNKHDLSEPGEFAKMLPDFELSVIFSPDRTGRPVLQRGECSSGAASYPHAVVARRRDNGRIIVFAGPACRGDFSPQQWRDKIDERRIDAANLRQFPAKFFQDFEKALTTRCLLQSRAHPAARGEECVGLAAFEWLKPDSLKLEEPKGKSTFTNSDMFGPDMYWGDRLYPFVSDTDAEVADISDPSQLPLRDWIEEDDERIAAEEQESEEPGTELSPSQKPGAPVILAAPMPRPTPAETPPAAMETTDASSSRDINVSASPVPSYYRPEKRHQRRRVQLEITVPMAFAINRDVLNKKKREREKKKEQKLERRVKGNERRSTPLELEAPSKPLPPPGPDTDL